MSINISTIEPQPNIPPQMSGEDVFYPETDGEPMAETDIHRELMNYLIEALKIYFQNDENVYVSGNILLYYIEGNPKKCVAPDVMICFGVENKKRRVYKLWEEEKRVPQVVFEISSTSTWRDDLSKKYSLYEKLGVKEYYIYDPEYKALDESLLAYYLIEGEFVKAEIENDRIFSPTLHLEIVDTGEDLRLFNPNAKEFLMTMEEMAAELNKLKNK